MFKGVSTHQAYVYCLRKGLCEAHTKEVSQNEFAAQKFELPRKAFLFIRVNILYPLLFKKSAKCEKIKILLQKTPIFSKIFADIDASEAADVIHVLDSVVIFTLCQLSKICCIGALFELKNEAISEDPEKKILQNILLVDRFDGSNLHHLYPLLQKNFIGCDRDLVKVSYVITLLFVRNYCIKLNIKSAIETIEKDLLGGSCWENFKSVADVFYQEGMYKDAANAYTSAVMQNSYSSELFTQRAQTYLKLGKLKAAQLDAYITLIIDPTWCEGYFILSSSLSLQKLYEEALNVANCGLATCKSTGSSYESLKSLHTEIATKNLNKESCNSISENSVNHSDSTEKPLTKNNYPVLVDSDSAESESEASKNVSELAEASDSDESETVEKKEVNVQTKSKPSGTTKKKIPSMYFETPVFKEDQMDVAKINSFLKEASEALLEDCGYKAVQIFRGPLRDLIESSKLLTFEECDIVCIKYSYGIAYCKSGAYDDLLKCITILKEIIEKHDSVTFPAAHYALGLTYRKLNRFKESLIYLETVKNFLCKGIHFKVYPWPGMTTVIQETKPETLKVLVDDLIKECENPPQPDALCRFAECSYQPTIYYTDPDFKGYTSLSCSEQCCLQYHLQCWKAIKTEKNLTDKEFIEQVCFTPDCEGVIVKIQNIDKKGDLSKEFTSDFKKPSKQKWAKWEKKTDAKDKKKKRVHSRSEDGTQEISNENGRVNSRKNSDANEKSILVQSSDSVNVPIENDSTSSESVEKSPQKVKEVTEFNDSKNDTCSSPTKSVETIPDIPCVSKTENEISNTILKEENASQIFVPQCIKNNVYSYMSDYLQHHGPLKIDDPLLVDELSSFPEEVNCMIAECGGIGEFLKNDLRFAVVGDIYVCTVSDLPTAYKMYSSSTLPTDMESLESLEDTNHSKYYTECNITHQSFGLNPDALEYTPAVPSIADNKDIYKFRANNSFSENLNNNISETFEHSSKCGNAISNDKNDGDSNLSTFQNFVICKSRSCDTVLDSKICNNSESIFSTSIHSGQIEINGDKDNKRRLSNEGIYKSRLSSEVVKSDSNVRAMNSNQHCWGKNSNINNSNVDLPHSDILEGISSCNNSDIETSKFNRIKTQLLPVFKEYCSESLNNYRQYIDICIKPYVIRKLPETVTTGTGTDELFENTSEEIASVERSKSLIDALNAENEKLVEQHSSLQKDLLSATKEKQELCKQVSDLKNSLAGSTFDLEVLKIEFKKKEGELLNGREYLVKSLTDTHETIDKQKKHIESLEVKNKSLTETLCELSSSLTVVENEMNKAIEAEEKKYCDNIKSLQEQNDELKSRAKYAEIQVLQLKKTEYLNKIDDKCLEASKRSKDFTDGLSIMSGNLNPMLQTSMKTLSAQFSSYVNELNALKVDFVRKIDEQIEKIEKDSSLSDIEEIEMKKIPDLPCWKNLLATSGPTLDKYPLNSSQMSFNFFNAGVLPQIPSAVITPPAAPSAAIVKPKTHIPQATPSTSIIPQATSSATIVPPSTTVAAVAPPIIHSVISSKANEKSELETDSEDFDILNLQIQKSFENTGTSINSFTSIPYSVPTLDKEFNKNCEIFKPLDPVSNNILKVPPGILNSAASSSSSRTVNSTHDSLETFPSSGVKPFVSISTASNIKTESSQSSLEEEKNNAATGFKVSYDRLLIKLKEQYPSYSENELVTFVKEVRKRRNGKLSGVPVNTIINEISVVMKKMKYSEMKVSEQRAQPKSNKVLVNKKLVPDPKPPVTTEQSVKKKLPWGNLDSDSKRTFTGSPDDDCTICCDRMTSTTAYKVACGHAFHEQCIRLWLKTKSNCPVCRVLLLLQDEYPSLS